MKTQAQWESLVPRRRRLSSHNHKLYISRPTQLARRWVLTIPREIPPDLYAVLVREFCEQQFVSKGMIVDFAIHDPHPPGHNPHAHVLLTMRAMDEHGKWLPKSRKV